MSDASSSTTVSATLVRIVTRAAGSTIEELAVEAGLPAAAVEHGIIGYADTVLLWNALAARTGDPIVGHRVGARLRLHEAGVFGALLAHSADVRSGLASFERAMTVALAHGSLRTRETSAGWEAVYRRPAARHGSRHGVEALFATAVSLLRQASDLGIACDVDFDTVTPHDPRPFESFYRGRVRFERAQNRLLVPRAALDAPMVGREPAIAAILAQHAPRLLRSESIEERTAQAAADALRAGDASAAAVAKRLGVSVRTMHRRLHEAGTRYRRILDAVCRDYASALLSDTSKSVEEIAAALGYSSRAAFDRAFRRWEGATAAEVRARRGGSGG